MEPDKQRLLNLLGLQPRMPALNRSIVGTYVRPSYLASTEAERDEVHRMSEIILIHLASGVRVGCLVEEDYYGENAEYVVMSNFHIFTRDGRRLAVEDIDLEKSQVNTAAGMVRFGEISCEPEH